MTAGNPLAVAAAINRIRQGYARHAERFDDDAALLTATHLIEIEALLTEAPTITGAAAMDRRTTSELRQAINELRRDPDPTIADLAAQLMSVLGRWSS